MLPVFDFILLIFPPTWFMWNLLPTPTKPTPVDTIVSVIAAGGFIYFCIRNYDLVKGAFMFGYIYTGIGIFIGLFVLLYFGLKRKMTNTDDRLLEYWQYKQYLEYAEVGIVYGVIGLLGYSGYLIYTLWF